MEPDHAQCRPGEAGPLIVRCVAITAGKVLANVIVPVTLKLIVSLPVPAAQAFVAVLVLAAVIASRSTHTPLLPASASELTKIVAASAAVARVGGSAGAVFRAPGTGLKTPVSPCSFGYSID